MILELNSEEAAQLLFEVESGMDVIREAIKESDADEKWKREYTLLEQIRNKMI